MKTSAKMTFHPRTVGLLVTVLLAAGSFSSCTNEQKAKSALLDAGYHPIEVKGYSPNEFVRLIVGHVGNR